MRRAKVADAQAPKRTYGVRWHRLGFLVSFASLCNVSSMPLAAYLSEPLPWQGALSPPQTYANYTEFNTAYLERHQQRYSNATLPTGTLYMCLSVYLLGLPGLIYYTKSQIDLLCRILTAPNTTLQHPEGSCYQNHLCSFTFGRSCLWLEPGDAISDPPASSGVATLYFVNEAARHPLVVWLMLIYRICTTLFVWYRLWAHYYRHCTQLESLVRRCGHRNKMPSGSWSYELVLGDPTAIVLLDPIVATLYYLDIWLSCTSFGTATMQVQASANVMSLLLGITYLARSVWFAYWGLCLVSYVLKRWRKEQCFSEVDPTLVAIAVTLSGPIMTYLNGHVTIFVRFYQWLFDCLVPTDRQNEEVEGALVCFVFTLFTLNLPLVHGLVSARRRRHRNIDYSACTYNNFKSAVLLRLAAALRLTPLYPPRGGSIYEAMEANPRLKRSPTISLRGTDCFLLCYCDGELTERLRLSLLTNVDGDLPRSTEPSEFVVYELQSPSAGDCDAILGPQMSTSNSALRAPPDASLWCI
ncbi:hypothetical protein SDRG_10271 [Saprolegnia diclina VS20]|uniref:Uncharacterized protein n=1 Tax=Saprolegnia diclina (strain VS20) TaxID=1156394 RepID=T0Q2L3_SAPDV|nr:hypothetical protein SDRG_10271 [Saprolegnia diclina VS20]EQC32074.1 hypothetical protein SDRG_10271 [Saprolegnia diclina VS20]|eukprot:XP_008614476.1 hypothetical protein SDRG_10271 [Saprolegnia diclina VS20]